MKRTFTMRAFRRSTVRLPASARASSRASFGEVSPERASKSPREGGKAEMIYKRWAAYAAVAAAIGAAALMTSVSQRAVSAADDKAHTTWGEYLGGADSNQYSALKQINKSNVKQLDVAWSYAAGEGTVRYNPIVVDNVMYVLGANRSIVALDAATGKEIWTHRNEGAVGDRGMNYWENKDRSQRRLLYLIAGFLTSIDA
jgi:glucose dehydrogenase